MRPPLRHLGILAAVLAVGTNFAAATYRGYVERPWAPSFCIQESHFLTDPCTGEPQWLLDEDGAIDMDPWLCRYVDVNGPDVGVECEIIAPLSLIPAAAPCPILFERLWISGDTPPRINWAHITCGRDHDVIRGDLARLTGAESRIDLGPVLCLADNLPQQEWWYVTGPEDAEMPRVGQAFFYLARVDGIPYGDFTYGYSSDNREHIASSGDCPPF